MFLSFFCTYGCEGHFQQVIVSALQFCYDILLKPISLQFHLCKPTWSIVENKRRRTLRPCTVTTSNIRKLSWELVWEWPAPHERELQSIPSLVHTCNKDEAEGAMDPSRLRRHWVLRRWTNVLRPCDENRDTGGACTDPRSSGNVSYNPII